MPSMLAILLFIISFLLIFIPLFEKNMMDNKKEMILELTNTAWSVLDEYHTKYKQGEITLEEAKKMAATQIEQMRYGPKQKDYFWIITFEPSMIMHPYRKELNNQNLENYTDSHENNVFVNAVEKVKLKGEGFISYYWQWKDEPGKVVPKLSFVKGFEEWNWIVGTGIYLEDVKEELSKLKTRLILISGIIVTIVLLILIYLIRQSLLIEKKRRVAEDDLKLSRQKYKSLVEASTEGTLMFVDQKVVFANMKFSKMLDCEPRKITNRTFDDIFDVSWNEISQEFSSPRKSVSVETSLKCKGNYRREIVISISRISFSEKDGIIVIAKDLTHRKKLKKDTKNLSRELQNSLHLMNQPIKIFLKGMVSCSMETSIAEAARIMSKKQVDVIFVHNKGKIIGVVNDSDFRKRVLANGIDSESEIVQVMTSPVHTIDEEALLYEAVLAFQKHKITHLEVLDHSGNSMGVISSQDCLEMQRNSLSNLIHEIEGCYRVEELKKVYDKLPVIVSALLSSSAGMGNITRLITSVADAILRRVIQFSLDDNGSPPCNFAFMVMGSEGRREQTLKTDQDNAILYENNEKKHQAYFLILAREINKNLDFIGYKNCPGQIMASNPRWCQSLSTWKSYFSEWTRSPVPQNILDSTIFFDFRYIHGEKKLIDELREHVNQETKHNDLFFYHLSNSIVNYKPSFENHTVNLKKLLLPITGYIRIYALYNQVSDTNSLARVKKLPNLDESRKAEIEKMYDFVMYLRISNQVHQILNNETPENERDLKSISKIEENTLKKILQEIISFQVELNMEFKGFGE